MYQLFIRLHFKKLFFYHWKRYKYNFNKYTGRILTDLPVDFVRKFPHCVAWWYTSRSQILSEEFIREFQDSVDWKYITAFQTLSEEFIREFQHRVVWDFIYIRQKLSTEFRKEFQHLIYQNN